MRSDWKDFIAQKYRYYTNLKTIPSPAFDGELVHFTKAGFRHLLRKKRFPRTRADSYRKLALLKQVPKVIGCCKKVSRLTVYDSTRVTIWELKWKLENAVMTVVIRSTGREKHFFSVYDEPLKPKSP